MSYYVTGFRWSTDPDAAGDARDLIDRLSDLPRAPVTPRGLGGPGDPIVLEAAAVDVHHPAIEPFDPDRWLAALRGELAGHDLGPGRAVELTLHRGGGGAALWTSAIVTDDRAEELLPRLGRALVAAGMSAYDHDTDAPLAPCRPKRWVLTGGASRWDPSWPQIAAELDAALQGDELRTLESAAGAFVQYAGTRDRLGVEHGGAGDAPPQIAGRAAPSGQHEIVRCRGLVFELDRHELLAAGDLLAIFEHFYREHAPHPGYHWRSRPPER